MAIVYSHIRLDNNEVFYIGIGANVQRAYSTHKRTEFWRKIVNKCGYIVKITHKDITWEEACNIEKYLISFYGRIDLGAGKLCNLTNGGDGTYGRICSKETKEKISIKAKDKFSKKENHPMYGRKQTKESKEKNSRSQLGEKSHMFGKRGIEHPMFCRKYTKEEKLIISKRVLGRDNPNAKSIIAINGNNFQRFDTIKDAKEKLGISSTSITLCCTGKLDMVKGYKFNYIK